MIFHASRVLKNIDDWKLARRFVGANLCHPDLVIAPDGNAYIYRWHLVREEQASVYFHIQVASDPERPLHDHPWDNTSVILSGGYDELWEAYPDVVHGYDFKPCMRAMRAGDVVHRKAAEAHRLLLPDGIPYTMSLFTTGPKTREWGFWYPEGWRSYKDVTELTADGRSVHKRT